jgi:protein-S-isoprenylcysteine O-methyltransferase Ste14
MMNPIRYWLGILSVVILPLGVLYWLIIHFWAHWWRKWGLARTYLTVRPAIAVLGVLLFPLRDRILGADLGTSWAFIGIALILYIPTIWLELQYWKHLHISILVGIPELSQGQGKLLCEGIYGIVRHPRYLSSGLGLIANALFVNHVGLYLLLIAIVPPGMLLLTLEERDLVNRFGDGYRDYQRDVPQLIPNLRKAQSSSR